MAACSVMPGRDPESMLIRWGANWRARLDGCPTENMSREVTVYSEEGDSEKERLALLALHPRLTRQEAVDAIKYAPLPRRPSMSPTTPGMAQIERDVSLACKAVGEFLFERFVHEELGVVKPMADLPPDWWRVKRDCVLGVRFLVREVYVHRGPVREWPGSVFDWIYPYAFAPKDRKSHGREAVLRLVKCNLLDSSEF